MGNCNRESHPQNNSTEPLGAAAHSQGPGTVTSWKRRGRPGKGQGWQDPNKFSPWAPSVWDREPSGWSLQGRGADYLPGAWLCGRPVFGDVHSCVGLQRKLGSHPPSRPEGHLGQCPQGTGTCVLLLECAPKMPGPSQPYLMVPTWATGAPMACPVQLTAAARLLRQRRLWQRSRSTASAPQPSWAPGWGHRDQVRHQDTGGPLAQDTLRDFPAATHSGLPLPGSGALVGSEGKPT